MAINLTDVQLTNIVTKTALSYRNELYIWDKIAPVINTTSSNGYIPKFGTKHKKHLNFKTGAYSPATAVDSDVSTISFSCEVHKGSVFIPEEIELQSDLPISLVTHGMEDLQESMQIEQELEVADWMTTGTNFTNKGTPGTKWDAASGDPAADITTMKSTILTSVGRLPNVCVVSPDVFLFLQEFVADQRMAGGSSKLADGTEIANWMGVPEIHVGLAQYDSAAKRKDSSMAQIWGTGYCWMFYRSPANSQNAPSFQYTVRNTKLTKTAKEVLIDPAGTKFILRDCRDRVATDETAGYQRYSVLT